MQSEFFIGLMSGTSMDAVDAALVDFVDRPLQVLATHREPIPGDLKIALRELAQPGLNEIQRLGELDVRVGLLFAEACQQLIQKSGLFPAAIKAIGSHGQTIRHQPNIQPGIAYPFTLQIGDPNIIAQQTGITTIADFRRRDLAVGGQGAPLVPAFHAFAFPTCGENRVVLNIGGIANVSFLPADEQQPVLGFDPGPGNTLLDAWARQHLQQDYDADGQWGAQGQVHGDLLKRLLADTYFQKLPPKSTGPEYFNLPWLQSYLRDYSLAPEDVQCTLVELTVQSILQAIKKFCTDGREILVCGGGVHNLYLMQCLETVSRGQYRIISTEQYGIHPDWMEAIAFAWLAKQTLASQPGNLPSVTGARQSVILGGVYAT